MLTSLIIALLIQVWGRWLVFNPVDQELQLPLITTELQTAHKNALNSVAVDCVSGGKESPYLAMPTLLAVDGLSRRAAACRPPGSITWEEQDGTVHFIRGTNSVENANRLALQCIPGINVGVQRAHLCFVNHFFG